MKYVGHKPDGCCDKGHYDAGRGWWCCDQAEALDHLGNVLYFMAGFHPDGRCIAFDEALAYYNRIRPGEIIVVKEENHGFGGG